MHRRGRLRARSLKSCAASICSPLCRRKRVHHRWSALLPRLRSQAVHAGQTSSASTQWVDVSTTLSATTSKILLDDRLSTGAAFHHSSGSRLGCVGAQPTCIQIWSSSSKGVLELPKLLCHVPAHERCSNSHSHAYAAVHRPCYRNAML